ncbi:outer membrane beta-barrel protein [Aureisphaera galaxeae]|uniref:outer membrane protein n=1 Tax=Aureisphaera galaxeae TaxID=1538023 RepID=UPI00234FBD97|nr:outer membrane beta-barrel protein [Aureisphaera galaxeae]MDC8002664.1 outer membrane beta-barrel protein [Aureisphaera galaxeae]
MKKLLLLVFICIGSFSYAQQVFVEAGRNTSHFKFKNDSGEELENLQSKTKSYVSAGYKHKLYKSLSLTSGLAYQSYGAIGSDDVLGNFFEWDIDYLSVNLGLDYDFTITEDVSFYLIATFNAEVMVDGVQTLNGQVFNVKDVEEFNDVAMFLRSGGGVRFDISEKAKIYAQYLYGSGLVLDDENNSANTELRINVHSFGIGVMVDIPCRKQEEFPVEGTTNETQN